MFENSSFKFWLEMIALVHAALRARVAIRRCQESIEEMPFACRKVDDANALMRELLIPFGGAGNVALFEITDVTIVTILAVRHQREDDCH